MYNLLQVNINNYVSQYFSKCCPAPASYGLESALNFFIFTTVKIFLLLSVIIFVITILRSFIPPEKAKKVFGGGKSQGIFGNVIASLIGVVTPFCTCSAVSIFIGFIKAGAPLGATFSFLIASPMVNEVALVLLLGMFGWEIALTYMITGVSIAIVGGYIIGKLNMEKYVEGYVFEISAGELEEQKLTWKQRINNALDYVKEILKKVWAYIIIGVAVGSIMYGWIPDNTLNTIAQTNQLFTVPLAVLIGIPVYASIAGIIPVVSELIRLGIPTGTALAFLMSVTALSLPELIILRNVLKPRLLGLFIGIMTISIILIGYLFNIVL